MLIDCGKASEVTHGQMNALWYEQGFAPFNRNVCYIPPNGQGIPQCERGDLPLDSLDLEHIQARVSDQVIG
jgi:hypothetical protein